MRFILIKSVQNKYYFITMNNHLTLNRFILTYSKIINKKSLSERVA